MNWYTVAFGSGFVIGVCAFVYQLEISDMRLRRTVFANLDCAMDSGYFEPGEALYGMEPHEIAYDMVQCSSDFEGFKPERLTRHIREWMQYARSSL